MEQVKSSITYTGILIKPNVLDTQILDELMRKYQSAKRFCRERIFDGLTRKETVNLAKPLFINNSRYMRDAFLEAESNISSQQELLPTYVIQYNDAIQKIDIKIKKIQKSKKHNKEDIIQRNLFRKKKLIKKRDYYQYHIDNRTVPKTVDGSKKKLILLNKGKITKTEWIDSRTNAMFSRGEKSKDGNENIKLTPLGNHEFELKVLNPLSDKRGDRLTFDVVFPEKIATHINEHLFNGEAYTIRLKRTNNDYEVHLTLDATNTIQPSFKEGVAGIDLNPDNISVSLTYGDGNFRASKVFWLHDINTVSTNKRSHIIGNMITEIVDWNQMRLGVFAPRFFRACSKNNL